MGATALVGKALADTGAAGALDRRHCGRQSDAGRATDAIVRGNPNRLNPSHGKNGHQAPDVGAIKVVLRDVAVVFR